MQGIIQAHGRIQISCLDKRDAFVAGGQDAAIQTDAKTAVSRLFKSCQENPNKIKTVSVFSICTYRRMTVLKIGIFGHKGRNDVCANMSQFIKKKKKLPPSQSFCG